MKNSKFRFFMDWGLTALAVIASCVLLCFALLKFSVIAAIIKKIITILMPIIYGGVLAYLMLPVYNRTEVCVRDLLSKVIKNDEGRTRIAKSIATLVSLAVCDRQRTGFHVDPTDLRKYHWFPGQPDRVYQQPDRLDQQTSSG